MKTILTILWLGLFAASHLAIAAQNFPEDVDTEWQPLAAQLKRVSEALTFQGAPLAPDDQKALDELLARGGDDAVAEAQKIFDAYCLLGVHINPESRVKVGQGPAKPVLVEQGWRTFLVKVHNEAGVTAELRAVSPHAQSLFSGGGFSNPSDREFRSNANNLPISDRWMDLQMFNAQPLRRDLSGLALEYRIIHLFSSVAGPREAKFMFNVGQGTQDIGFRNEADILFTAQATRDIKLRVLDENGAPAVGAFLIRDAAGRIYPSQAKRLAPDFGFHPQVYRADGESIKLPFGSYKIEFSRGPESITEVRDAQIGAGATELKFQVKRWIDPSL
ncbi:MAG: CehA/McbA family metallohydrolase, partial [Limisphaerales bacterium]